jgi:hypothetical protein
MNVKKYGQKLNIVNGGFEYSGGLTGDTILLNGGIEIDTFVENSGLTESSSVVYTEKATKQYVENYLSVSLDGYYTSGETDALLDGYYTTSEVDTILSDYLTTGSTLEDISGVSYGKALEEGDVLVYSGGTWTNEVPEDVSDLGYLTSGETFDLADDRYVNLDGDTMTGNLTVPSLTADTSIFIDSTTITGIENDDILIYDNNNLATTSAITTYVADQISQISLTTALSDLTDVTVSAPSENNILQYNGTIWENREGLTLDGNAVINGNVNILNDLYVSGTTITVNTQDLTVEDNIITLNSGETNQGVTKTFAGVVIDRGQWEDYIFIFQEDDPMVQDSGTFRIGVSGDTQAVATREDDPDDTSISYWSSVDNMFKTSLDFTYNSGTSTLSVVNISLGGDLITGITDDLSTSATNWELATASSIVNYVGSLDTDITLSGDTGSFKGDGFSIIGGSDISTVMDNGTLTVNFDGAYYDTISGDTGSNTITTTGETLTFIGGSGITTSVSGNDVTIDSIESIVNSVSVNNSTTGTTDVVGVVGTDGNAIIEYHLTDGSLSQEGQIRVLLDGTSSGLTWTYQGNELDISFGLEVTGSDVKLEIYNDSGSTLTFKYILKNIKL